MTNRICCLRQGYSLELRHYQRSAIDAVTSYLIARKGNPLITIPPGCGKSYIVAQFLKETISKYPSTRFIVATHAKELVSQDHKELMALWPSAPSGILSAGLGSKAFHNQIIFAGIQTAYKHAFKLQRCDALVVDEPQSIPHSGDGMWRQFISDLRRINPNMPTIGLSATNFRMDSGLLHRGPGAIFTDVVYEYKLLDAIREGYLCEIVPVPTNTHLAVTGVLKGGGEFIQGELERAVDVESTTQAAVREIVRLGADRRSWLVFASGVKHAQHIRDAIRAYGVACEAVTSDTPTAERDNALNAFKAFQLRALVVVGIGGVGFNHPGLDFIASLRPTGSAGLWYQQCGRGTRLYPGKVNCLLADFAKNTERHGPLDQIRGHDPKSKGEGEAPQKRCDLCYCYMHSSAKVCPDCGVPMPEHSIDDKLSATASNAAILSTQIKPQSLEVKSWRLLEHEKPGKPLSMRVEYNLGISKHSEYVTIQHFGEARNRAVIWWAKHKGQLPPPSLVSDAISRQKELTMPRAIVLAPNGKYQEIVGREW